MLIFTLVVMFVFKGETLHWRYALVFCLMIVAFWLVLGESLSKAGKRFIKHF